MHRYPPASLIAFRRNLLNRPGVRMPMLYSSNKKTTGCIRGSMIFGFDLIFSYFVPGSDNDYYIAVLWPVIQSGF